MTQDEAIKDAIAAYRGIVDHLRKLDEHWVPKHARLAKLDSFHRSRVARENAYYWGREIRDYAVDVLLSVVRGEVPDEPVRIIHFRGDEKYFRASATKNAQKCFDEIDALRKAVEKHAREK